RDDAPGSRGRPSGRSLGRARRNRDSPRARRARTPEGERRRSRPRRRHRGSGGYRGRPCGAWCPQDGAARRQDHRAPRAMAAKWERQHPTQPPVIGRTARLVASRSASERKGGLGSSAPRVARWLGDIRAYFPTPILRRLQRDAVGRLELRKWLLGPELLSAVVPDVPLVTMRVSLAAVMPARTRETARLVVRRVVDDLLARVELPLRQAVAAGAARAARSLR